MRRWAVHYFIGLRAGVPKLAGEARDLELLGFDGISVGDHRGQVDAAHVWATLGAVSVATSRVTLASKTSNNLFRHPVEFVQAALSIHAISGGRFEAGIGAGWARSELESIGATLPGPRERVDRLREACEIARPLLAGQGCDYEGTYYSASFPPVDGGLAAPPLVAALGGPRSCRIVAPLVDRVEVMYGAAVADGSLDFAQWAALTFDDLRVRAEIVREAAPDVPLGVDVFVAAGSGDDVSRLKALAGSGLQAEFVGEPQAVADALSRLSELGVDRVGLSPMTAGTAEALAPHLIR